MSKKADTARTGPEEIPLRHPRTHGGVTFDFLRMRRAKARDSRDAWRPDEGPHAHQIRLFAALCDTPLEVIEELDMADYGELQERHARWSAERHPALAVAPPGEIPLSYPVEHGGTTVTRLVMRRAKARDSRDAWRPGEGPGAHEMRLFVSLCEVAPEVIEELDMADYAVLQETFSGFLAC